jgi:hypothetical protein
MLCESGKYGDHSELKASDVTAAQIFCKVFHAAFSREAHHRSEVIHSPAEVALSGAPFLWHLDC